MEVCDSRCATAVIKSAPPASDVWLNYTQDFQKAKSGIWILVNVHDITHRALTIV